ncbi:MAG: hypothetical protein WC767_03980, partial [Candidatus Paceibacterota bacterium]
IDSSLVTWTVNGKEVKSGIGEKEITVVAGRLGSVIRVDAKVSKPGQAAVTETVIIRPATVDLIWESDSYVPPFYKGKALASYNGSFRVTAIPEFVNESGVKIPAKELVYTWKKDGEVQGADSGYGKNSFISSKTSYLKQNVEIAVEVSAPRDNIVGGANTTITPVAPKVAFYEESPLYGTLFDKAIGPNFYLMNEELSLVAEPYFFSVGDRESPALSYIWKVNGVSVPEFSDEAAITLRRENGEAGLSRIGLVVQNRQKVLQGAKGNISVTFDEITN